VSQHQAENRARFALPPAGNRRQPAPGLRGCCLPPALSFMPAQRPPTSLLRLVSCSARGAGAPPVVPRRAEMAGRCLQAGASYTPQSFPPARAFPRPRASAQSAAAARQGGEGTGQRYRSLIRSAQSRDMAAVCQCTRLLQPQRRGAGAPAVRPSCASSPCRMRHMFIITIPLC